MVTFVLKRVFVEVKLKKKPTQNYADGSKIVLFEGLPCVWEDEKCPATRVYIKGLKHLQILNEVTHPLKN